MNFEKLISRAKAVVFDLGGVILNINPQLTYEEFIKLGFPDYRQYMKNSSEQSIFDDFEKGKCSPSEFRKFLCTNVNVTLSNQQFDKAWNSMLLDIPANRIETLMQTSKQTPIYLLSNTNKIHYDHYKTKAQHAGVNHVSDLFTNAFYSHEIGMRKPDDEIFQFLIEQLCCSPDQIVFIDDLEDNIASADRSGIKTIHICNGKDISSFFDRTQKL